MIQYSVESPIKNWALRHFLVSSVLFAGVIIVAGFVFIVRGYYVDSVSTKARDLIELKQILTEKKQFLEDLSQVETYLSTINDETKTKVMQALPSDEKLAELYTQVEAITLENNLTLEAVDLVYEKTEYVPGVSRLKVSLSVSGGTYDNFKGMIQNLEENLRIFDVNMMDYSPEALTYTVAFSTYYLSAD